MKIKWTGWGRGLADPRGCSCPLPSDFQMPACTTVLESLVDVPRLADLSSSPTATQRRRTLTVEVPSALRGVGEPWPGPHEMPVLALQSHLFFQLTVPSALRNVPSCSQPMQPFLSVPPPAPTQGFLFILFGSRLCSYLLFHKFSPQCMADSRLCLVSPAARASAAKF